MLKFCNAFSGLKNVRNIIHQGLVRAICFTIAAEYEAVQLCPQLAEPTDNSLVDDIASEEREHAGEF